SFYTAENPPFGLTFTFHLKEALKTKKQKRKDAEKEAEKNKKDVPYPTKDELRAEAEEEPPAVLLTITDFNGDTLRTLQAPTGEGVHRVTWDLRESGVSVGGREDTGGGPLVV